MKTTLCFSRAALYLSVVLSTASFDVRPAGSMDLIFHGVCTVLADGVRVEISQPVCGVAWRGSKLSFLIKLHPLETTLITAGINGWAISPHGPNCLSNETTLAMICVDYPSSANE